MKRHLPPLVTAAIAAFLAVPATHAVSIACVAARRDLARTPRVLFASVGVVVTLAGVQAALLP